MLREIKPDDIKSKSQFIRELLRFVACEGVGIRDEYGHADYQSSRGEIMLVDAIAGYFEAHTEIPDKVLGINWFKDVPAYLVDAFIEFRTDPKHEELRKCYRAEVKCDIPDLLDICGGFAHGHVTRDLTRLMPLLAGRGSWLRSELESYFNGEMTVIDHAWRRFIRQCYRPGLIQRIKVEDHRGNAGIFGRTTLRSWAGMGRVMFTFARSDKTPDLSMLDQIVGFVETEGVDAEAKLAAIEAVLMTRRSLKHEPDTHQVTFVADDGDLHGFRSGINYGSTPYAEAVAMINDVVDNWNPSKFIEDRNVSLGVKGATS